MMNFIDNVMGNAVSKAAVVDFVIQWCGWTIAALMQTEKFYDLTGSSTFVFLTLFSLNQNKILHPRQKINSGLVIVWALRLGVFLVTRIMKDDGDKRFNIVKHKPALFWVYWTVQGVWVLSTLLPTILVNSKKDNKPIQLLDYAGWSIWGLGFILEVVADYQKSQFRSNPDNLGKFISTGLWSISRHPNYLGEILMWTGLYTSSLSSLKGWEHISIISPLLLTFLLINVSGIPPLESAGMKRWGRNPEYIDYIQNTAKLIPFFW